MFANDFSEGRERLCDDAQVRGVGMSRLFSAREAKRLRTG